MSDRLEIHHKGARPKDIDSTEIEITRLRSELAAVTAEREMMREALRRIDGMATTICMTADAGYGMKVETVMPIYETARAAIEGVTEKEGEGAGNE